MKNNPESGEFCCLHICLFNNGKAIHFRTTLTPLRLLSLLLVSICDTGKKAKWSISHIFLTIRLLTPRTYRRFYPRV